MTKQHYLTSFFLLFIVLFVQSCATTDNKAYFNNHEVNFKLNNEYKTHFINRKDGNIHVREYGSKNNKPTLVLMHGFPDSMHLYDWLIPEFHKDRHIITFDFLGWGDSDKPENHVYDFSSLRVDLETVIKAFNLNQMVLVLHDASGLPGIDWALENENNVAGLVLLNTVYNPMATLKAPDAIELFSTPGIKRDVAIIATRLSDTVWISEFNKQMAKFISDKTKLDAFQKIIGHQSLQIRNAFYGLNDVLQDEVNEREKNIAKMKHFTKPVRIIFGKNDTDLNTGVAKEFKQLFPNSELFLLDNAGHFVQVEAPKRVAKLISDFLIQERLTIK